MLEVVKVEGLTVVGKKLDTKVVADSFERNETFLQGLSVSVSKYHTEKRFIGMSMNEEGKKQYDFIDLPTIDELNATIEANQFQSINEAYLFVLMNVYDRFLKYCGKLARQFEQIEAHDIFNEVYCYIASYPFAEKWEKGVTRFTDSNKIVSAFYFVASDVLRKYVEQSKVRTKFEPVYETGIFEGIEYQYIVDYKAVKLANVSPMNFGGKTEVAMHDRIIRADIMAMLDVEEQKAYRLFKKGYTVREAVMKGIKRRKYDSMKNKLKEYASDIQVDVSYILPAFEKQQ